MTRTIVWQCGECGNMDSYPLAEDKTLEEIQSSNANTMCSQCGAPSQAVSIEYNA